MPKRKRDGSEASASEFSDFSDADNANDGSGAADSAERNISMRQHRIEQKLEHGHKLLARAFKTAKGFEAQKSGRRRKTAGAKGDRKEVERIEAETASLKTLDLSLTARNYLYKSLIKFKAVAESPDLPKNVSKPPVPVNDTTKANVIARLCNSNPVKEALSPILIDIQRALGVEVKDIAKGKKRLRAKDIEKQKELEKQEAKALQTKTKTSAGEDSGDVSMGEDDESAALQVARGSKESGGVSDDEFAEFNDRLADSSDSDSEGPAEPGKGKQSRAAALRAILEDISPSASPSPSPSPEPESKSTKTTKPNASAFVPSLTMGGYWSGSESEPEDDIEKNDRKNRRGQRARRAIAEKKFGQKAKHLQGQERASGKKDRNAGWDPRKGATDGSGPRRHGGPRSSRFEKPSGFGGNQTAEAPPMKKHRDDTGSLHPSWEAAKKAKEAKKVMANFEGKKITFD